MDVRLRTQVTRSAIILCRALLAAILIILSSVFGAQTAHACAAGMAPFSEFTIDLAETVFRGRAVAYEIVRNDAGTFARLSFEVVETYKGHDVPVHSAFWSNSTFGLPASLEEFTASYGDDIVAGLGSMSIAGALAGARASEPFVFRLYFPELFEGPWVLQSPCEPPFMGDFDDFEPLLRRQGILN